MQHHAQLSVLIISDEPGVARILLAIFHAIDVTKKTAVGGADVPDYDRFDMAVICCSDDVHAALAAADGIRHARSGNGAYIVALTSNATDALQRCIEWGRFDALLLMPVTIAGLTTHIECAIERAMRA